MSDFLTEVTTKKVYIPNIVIKLDGVFFRSREPDDGPLSGSGVGLVGGLTIAPTTIDPFRPTTSISNYSFSLIDELKLVSQLFADNGKKFQGTKVEIWLGRSRVNMPFSAYFKLPDTYIAKVSKDGPKYNFSSQELRDRLTYNAFNKTSKLASDIFVASTVIPLVDASMASVSGGMIRISGDNFGELITFTGVSGNNLIGVTRGVEGTDPLDFKNGTQVDFVTKVEGHPLDIFLQMLISQGGGGTYDVLDQGAGIDPNLVNIERLEMLRDGVFAGAYWNFPLYIGGVEDLRKFISEEILYPLNLRFRTDGNKISVAVLDREIFNIDAPVMNHDNIIKAPSYDVSGDKIRNKLRIFYDWSERLQNYLNVSEFSDDDSIDDFEERPVSELKFKGIQSALGGVEAVEEIAALFLARFNAPRPDIGASTHMDAFFSNVGEKVLFETDTLPNDSGGLQFAETLEVVSQAINVQTGDIKFGLQFNSYAGVRSCYLAPSDVCASVISQRKITVGAGRSNEYRVGWKVRLYDDNARDWVSPDQINTIKSIDQTTDTIEFVDLWVETLDAFKRITFADYNDVTEQQKKYCFISAGTNLFADGKKPYQILF